MKKGMSEEMDRRDNIRLEKTLPLKFNLPGTSLACGPFEALSRNIAPGGLFIETDLPHRERLGLRKDRLLDLELELLGCARSIKPQGRIVWISKKSRAADKAKFGFGIKFTQITPEEKKEISLFISQELLWQAGSKEVAAISRQPRLKDRNRRNLEILDAIRKKRLISRAEISQQTGINIVTISNYIDAYLKKGLVLERGLDISTGGRRPELVEINPQYGYVIGVDLGSLNTPPAQIKAVVVDFNSHVLSKAKAQIPDGDVEKTLFPLRGLITQVVQDAALEREKIKGVGIGIGGIMDKLAGTVRNPLREDISVNLAALKKQLEDTLGLPVFIENSATCALFGEKWAGLNLDIKDANHIIYIASESQCAIIINGEIYTGSGKNAGQLNFALPRNNSFSCDYCWEDDSSYNCLLRSSMQDLSLLNSREEIAALGARVGAKIAYLVNLFNPEVVILGGGFYQLDELFLDTIRQTVGSLAFRESSRQVRIIPASLAEDAVAEGAASLVIEATLVNI